MGYRVLILDDDGDFNSLLTDVFEQAGYVVTSVEDPIKAVELFQAEEYDMVLTDHRMPDMMGSEFVKVVKEINPDIPIVMVSGYLENNTIRELIGHGIGGVFLKPLNVFSLLERATELIDEAKKWKGLQEGETVEEAVETDEKSSVATPFKSFPCKSAASIQFSERLWSLRNFKSSLTLVGERGTHYREICEDISRFSSLGNEDFVYFSPASFSEEHIFSLFESLKEKEVERFTCVFLDVDSMSDTQKRLINSLSKADDQFAALDTDIRSIYCINGDIDEFFDEGLINEDLYIQLGTSEVQVPALRNCPMDIPIMAQDLVERIWAENGKAVTPKFDASAKNFLRQHHWPLNYLELSNVVTQLYAVGPVDKITHGIILEAIYSLSASSPLAQFSERMLAARSDLIRAMIVLFDDDYIRVAKFFGVEVYAIEALVS